MAQNNTVPKKEKKFEDTAHRKFSLFNFIFNRKQSSIFEEENIETPFKTVVKTFRSNKMGMTALVILLTIFLTVTIIPIFYSLDLSFSDASQTNIPPGLDLMKFPKELEGNLKQISVGPSFSVGLSNDGQVYVWGKSKLSRVNDLRNIPKNMGKVVQVAAGYDHILALNDQGKLFAWGSNRHQQTLISAEVASLDNIKSIYAGYLFSMVLTEDGHTYYFGNTMLNDYDHYHPYQGQIAKIANTENHFVGLTFDGDVVYLGRQSGAYSNIPKNMGKVIDVASTSLTFAALNDQGEVFIWGNPSTSRGERLVPETDSKITKLFGGRHHYVALTEDKNLISWGFDNYGQATIPRKVERAEIDTVFNGFYQNYAVTKDGRILTWGLKGYPLGSDDLGRDQLQRILHGGRLSMTIGVVAVLISTFVAIIVGGVSGYFGGKIDLVLQRVSEMIASLPFLPFAMILSALIGNRLTNTQKVYMIMVILGLLSWPGLQRLIRAQVLSIREQEYVTAAKVLGVKQNKIIFKHIIPNVISVIIVSATLSFGGSMITEASLSFLGFGVQPPQPTWGNMLNGARNSVVIQNYWWRWVFPSLVLSICVICINIVGEALRAAIDPKSQER
ncbi:peptide/nickel transport system permease protein [Anaerobranca californiensis DSM 14826]|jgi:peptide/nickel transport system permease protein|uniref:Peptide/nickel transport system permease protein n=1 Tax=Anaerobranca californiensis DSM 14826 TaxID=1120989 RepID=A0A1M6PRD6_9FIRM|nr:ABC transporter permease subunit [Anaerobranca californiensis]SHK10441.1 peptide/nickel transport system permease protein [Anaerobranca californiensis DSM 14826]